MKLKLKLTSTTNLFPNKLSQRANQMRYTEKVLGTKSLGNQFSEKRIAQKTIPQIVTIVAHRKHKKE